MNKNDIIDQDQEIYSKVYKELNFIKTNLIMVFDKDKNLVTKTCLKRSQERNREEEKFLSINYMNSCYDNYQDFSERKEYSKQPIIYFNNFI